MSTNHVFVATANATAASAAAAAALPTEKCSSSITNTSGNGDPGSSSSSSIGSSAFLVSGKNFRKSNIKREPLFFLIIMKLNLKTLLSMLIAIVVITVVIFWSYADHSWDSHLHKAGSGNELQPVVMLAAGDAANAATAPLQNIECWINQEYTIPCKRSLDSSEVYVPFSFLRSYFDISGAMVSATSSSSANEAGAGDNDNPLPRFSWMHSTAKVNVPRGKYDARGRFAYFENYNVEVRDRVKCISAKEGVPISTQWEKSGYFYPTQIAQFALAHYSKNLSEPPPRIKVFEDGDANQMQWLTPKSSNITRIWHPKFNTSVIQYETAIGYDSAVRIDIDNVILDLVLSVDLLLVTNSSSLMVTLQHRDTRQHYRLHYIPADLRLSTQEDNIYYGMGIGALNRWRRLTRDLYIDVQKGIANDKKSATKVRRNELRLVSVAFLGVGFFDNITLSTYNHMAHFYDAAEWFVHNQDTKTGGWPNPVKRSLNGFTELKAGWLSAMGQGHALSVLSRAFYHSGSDKRYLKAAAMGLKPFRVFSKDGGVLAQFMDKYYWYEEYPTTPPSFVLNGFIYSLLGLYDLNTTAPTGIAREAGRLFSQGMQSLKKMLLLYDTGSGTSYDLRHLSLGVPPNLARADYHATHVSQLLLLATIDSDPLIIETAERWKGYMFGKRAKHN